jgi:hypothetical protein
LTPVSGDVVEVPDVAEDLGGEAPDGHGGAVEFDKELARTTRVGQVLVLMAW